FTVRQQPDFFGRRTSDPDAHWREHQQHEQSNHLQSLSPAKVTRQKVDEHRGDNASQPQTQVGVPHGASAQILKPAGNQNLVGNGTSQHIPEDLHHAEQLVVPELGHRSHEYQSNTNECDSYQDDQSGANAINDGPGQEPEREAGNQKPQQEPLCDLR